DWTGKQTAWALGIGCVVVFLVGWLIWWLTKPPQLGGDPDVVRTVDALFTAVTARDEKLLTGCEQRLRASKEAGKLGTEPFDYLDGIIRKARTGRWQSAAEKLYDFMKVQRRDGPHVERKKQNNYPSLVRK